MDNYEKETLERIQFEVASLVTGHTRLCT